jgi:hypothetical protein
MFFPERITFCTVPAGLDLCVPQFISKAISFYIARTLKTHYRALNTGEREGHVRNNNPYLGLQELSGRKQKHKTVWSNHYNQFLASLSLSRPFKGERASERRQPTCFGSGYRTTHSRQPKAQAGCWKNALDAAERVPLSSDTFTWA